MADLSRPSCRQRPRFSQCPAVRSPLPAAVPKRPRSLRCLSSSYVPRVSLTTPALPAGADQCDATRKGGRELSSGQGWALLPVTIPPGAGWLGDAPRPGPTPIVRTRAGISEQRCPAGEIRTPFASPVTTRVATRQPSVGHRDRSDLLVPAWPVARSGKSCLLYLPARPRARGFDASRTYVRVCVRLQLWKISKRRRASRSAIIGFSMPSIEF